jgi:hypothetical protein
MARKKRVAEALDRPPAPVKKVKKEPDPIEQSGDLQGLSEEADADSESVRELVEEGQFFEAEVINGVENAPPADAGPVKTRERKVDDVPPEYTDDRRQDEPKE